MFIIWTLQFIVLKCIFILFPIIVLYFLRSFYSLSILYSISLPRVVCFCEFSSALHPLNSIHLTSHISPFSGSILPFPRLSTAFPFNNLRHFLHLTFLVSHCSYLTWLWGSICAFCTFALYYTSAFPISALFFCFSAFGCVRCVCVCVGRLKLCYDFFICTCLPSVCILFFIL